MIDTSRVIETAMALRAHATAEWEAFVDAMIEYSSKMTLEMVRASPDMIMRAQGMAIMANEISTLLHDAPKLYEARQKMAANRPPLRNYNG